MQYRTVGRYITSSTSHLSLVSLEVTKIDGNMKRVKNKKAWRKVLTEWKKGPGKYYTALQKQWFPSLLSQFLDEMDNRDELAVAGFRATGIYPIDKDHIMRKITNENVKSAHNLVFLNI